MLMNSLLRLAPAYLAAALFSLTGLLASTTHVEIIFENLSEDGGLWNTPLFLGFHDGIFDPFNIGDPASASVEALAEEGDPMKLLDDIGMVGGAKSGVLFGDDAPGVGPGVLFNPGSSNSLVIKLNASTNRYLSFASMLLPSNDAFIGNDDPIAHDLFDAMGNFNDGFSIDLFGTDVWDAGTEENDGMGAPFSVIGGVSTPTVGGVVSVHGGLNNFVGTGLANMTTLEHAFEDSTPIGRISARRVPDTAPAAGVISFLFLLGFQRVVNRRKNGTD